MEASAEGRASLSNILYDYSEGRLPKPLLRRFLNDVAEHWKNSGPTELPEDVLRKVVGSDSAAYLCMGCEVPIAAHRCSRVMNVQDLVENNLDLTKIPFAIRGHLTSGQISFLEKFGFSGATKGRMRTRRPFAWVTKTESLSQVKANTPSPEQASLLRNLLGLLHFQKDEHLVEIQYPENIMKVTKFTAPTFLEGCPSLIYRSKSTSDRWGRAVNLEDLTDGLPEAVHTEIPFTDQFTLADLGRLRPLRSPFDWEAFLRTFPRRWTSDSLGELESYA